MDLEGRTGQVSGHIKGTAQSMRSDDMIVAGLGERTTAKSLNGQ
jgi:hypothetical protein